MGLMGQGLQRRLDASGRVVALTEPSPLLEVRAAGWVSGPPPWLLLCSFVDNILH